MLFENLFLIVALMGKTIVVFLERIKLFIQIQITTFRIAKIGLAKRQNSTLIMQRLIQRVNLQIVMKIFFKNFFRN